MRHRRGWWTTFGIFLCLYMFIYFWGVGVVSKPSKLKKVMITSLLLCALSAQAEVVLHSAASIVWLSVNEINSIFFFDWLQFGTRNRWFGRWKCWKHWSKDSISKICLFVHLSLSSLSILYFDEYTTSNYDLQII